MIPAAEHANSCMHSTQQRPDHCQHAPRVMKILFAGLQVLAAAVKFAAAFQETQMPLLRSMQTLHAHHSASVRCRLGFSPAALCCQIPGQPLSPFHKGSACLTSSSHDVVFIQ